MNDWFQGYPPAEGTTPTDGYNNRAGNGGDDAGCALHGAH